PVAAPVALPVAEPVAAAPEGPPVAEPAVADPEVQPAVAEESAIVEAPKPAPSPRGRVSVEGPVTATLISDRGRRQRPGRVPTGTYQLEFSFEGGDTMTLPTPITVTANQTVTVVCDPIAALCRVR
ncbi:MAG: hypothetical protein H6739_16250, partial [Alphaproteobacteria bacterium]|nr:hypothetical protein [Alphaproteobacteria bacterium]